MSSKQKLRLSHSSLDTLNACERKFQIEKLLITETIESESPHFSYGHSFGDGVACYLATQNRELALIAGWKSYWPKVENDKKTEARALISLERAFDALDNLLMEYELVHFQSKPATELSFRLDIDEDYYFVGYIDAVLRHRFTNQYVIFECKTTSSSLIDLSPLYKHSGQALGYSIALDSIVGEELSSYGVLYFVNQLGRDFTDIKIKTMPFTKTLLDRLNWFIALGIDVKRLHLMKELGVYPKRYQACLSFNRPCIHFGTCHLHSFDKEKEIEPDEIEYQFCFNLDDLVANHLQRIGSLASLSLEE